MSIAGGDNQPLRDAGDTAIVDILARARSPVVEDTQAIITRMASSPFNSRRRDLSKPLVALVQAHGYTLDEQPTELTHHWAKHVLGDGQWTAVTTKDMYVNDLQRAIRHDSSRFFVRQSMSGERIAIAVAQSAEIVPTSRRGRAFGPELLVVYSADIGKIISGYMVASSLENVSRPGTIWLPT